jgi:hypothetical protein
MAFGVGTVPWALSQNHNIEHPTICNNKMADWEIREVGPTIEN